MVRTELAVSQFCGTQHQNRIVAARFRVYGGGGKAGGLGGGGGGGGGGGRYYILIHSLYTRRGYSQTPILTLDPKP